MDFFIMFIINISFCVSVVCSGVVEGEIDLDPHNVDIAVSLTTHLYSGFVMW